MSYERHSIMTKFADYYAQWNTIMDEMDRAIAEGRTRVICVDDSPESLAAAEKERQALRPASHTESSTD